MRRQRRMPKYRRQKRTGATDLAFIEIHGRRIYLGDYDDEESREEYRKCLVELAATGTVVPPHEQEQNHVTIVELVDRFLQHAETYYINPDGTPSKEQEEFAYALRPLHTLYGRERAKDFGPRKLKTVRQSMIDHGLARSTINKRINKIRQVFRWGVEEELVPGAVHEAIKAVRGLRRGRSEARETEPVRPVPLPHVEAVREFVSRQVWALIQLQLFTGARPGELVIMRPVDIDMTRSVWVYAPTRHKTQHHGKERRIYIGPRAQQVIEPFLAGRPVDAFMFSPAEAEAERREQQHARRTTPLSCGNRPGTNRRRYRRRKPSNRYTPNSYRKAICHACEQAWEPPDHLARKRVPGVKGERWETNTEWRDRLGDEKWAELDEWRKAHRWHPHQLRHTHATDVRRDFGLEAAQLMLGHSSAKMSEQYAERNEKMALEVAAKIG